MNWYFLFSLLFVEVVLGKSERESSLLLDSSEFHRLLQSEDNFLCHFFKNDTEKSVEITKILKSVSEIFYGIIKIVATSDEDLVNSHAGSGSDSLLLFIKDKNSEPRAVVYPNAKDVESITKFLKKQLGSLISARSNLENKTKNNKGKDDKRTGSDSEIVKLTDSTFNQLVLKDTDSVWFIMFYAPWCGHCKSLKPVWKLLSAKLSGKVKVGAIDCTTETNTAQQFAIQGFPTLILFESGIKSVTSGRHYEGPRTLDELESFALSFKRVVPFKQLLNDELFSESCKNSLCIIAFLPHILDSSAEERNRHLAMLKRATMTGFTFPISFLWSQGGDQYDLENSLNLSFGYPALVALRLDKQLYVVHKGSFEEASIKKFINALAVSIKGAQALPTLKPLEAVDPWEDKAESVKTEL